MKTVIFTIIACFTFSLSTTMAVAMTAAMTTDDFAVGTTFENVVVITDSKAKTFSISTDKGLLLDILDSYPDGVYYPYNAGAENLTKKMEIHCSIQKGKVTKLRPGKCL